MMQRLPIYRMTHIDNVPFILRNGLWSKLSAEREAAGTAATTVASPSAVAQDTPKQGPAFKAIGNATKSISRFFNNLQSIQELDWTTIRSTLWKNTDDDYDRVRKKMAERRAV